jgi:hypothetical protein
MRGESREKLFRARVPNNWIDIFTFLIDVVSEVIAYVKV